MTVKQTAATGGAVALIVCGTVLGLLWKHGVWHFVQIGRIDLQAVLWPSSEMLTVGWRTTIPGITRTIISVAINCFLYVGTALLLRSVMLLGRFRISILATCVSAVSTFVLWNTALVLTGGNYCIVLFTVPYTDKSFALPRWVWGPIPISVCAISTLTAVVLWIKLLVSRTRTRHSLS